MSAPTHSQTDQRREIALSTLLCRIAKELEVLSDLADTAQLALSHCIFLHPPETTISAGLQGMDRISQELEDLHRLTKWLERRVPDDQHVEASALRTEILLRDLADRLTAPNTGDRREDEVGNGDVNWF